MNVNYAILSPSHILSLSFSLYFSLSFSLGDSPPHRSLSIIVEDGLRPSSPFFLPVCPSPFFLFPIRTFAGSFPSSCFLAKPIFHPRSKTLRHLLESSSIREYSVSAPRQKTVVGELARHTVELYPDGAGALDRLGGPTASVVFRRASSQHYEHYF